MTRLKPLSIDEVKARGIDVAPFLAEFEELPGSVATLAYRPDILGATLGLWGAVMGPGALPADLKYLAGYLASMSAGCLYCSAHTATNSLKGGASPERLEAVWDYERSPLFSDAERAALRFAQLAGQAPSGVTDGDMDALKVHYREAEIVELLAVVALYGFFNRWNDSLATPLEPTPLGVASAHLGDHGWSPGNHA